MTAGKLTAAEQFHGAHKESGQTCKNAKFHWHQIDGYCKECRVHAATDEQIRERRTAKGYR